MANGGVACTRSAWPELVWGVVSRGVGLVFLIAFLSLRPQVLVIAGRTGILPIAEALPTWRRFFYFPTLLWLSSSDWALRGLVWLGIAAAAFLAWPLTLCRSRG